MQTKTKIKLVFWTLIALTQLLIIFLVKTVFNWPSLILIAIIVSYLESVRMGKKKTDPNMIGPRLEKWREWRISRKERK
jgi:hypothetical protein